MRKSLFLTALLAALLAFGAAPRARAAQVGFSLNIGPAPVCPYGYFPYPPYACAPWGYYGPGWFENGIFIGAGPWFHGHPGFHAWVNNHYDPRFGYHGAMPHRGERDQWDHGHWRGHPTGSFHGNEMRDGHGAIVHGDHGHGH